MIPLRLRMAARLIAAGALFAAPAAAQDDPAAAARRAAADLTAAAAALDAAGDTTGDPADRIAAMTATVRAFEAGLMAMDGSIRAAAARERDLRAELAGDDARIAALIGAALALRTAPEATSLLHPEGPVAAARAGTLVAGLAPALLSETEPLRRDLSELGVLRAVQDAARGSLADGLAGVERARARLAAAAADRRAPEVGATDAATLQALVEGADTLQGFAATLAGSAAPGPGFAALKGGLPWPAAGQIVAGGTLDSARPGITLALPARALVTSPVSATVRYAGPLLTLGHVVILEPEAGWLVVLTGLGAGFAQQGALVDAGAPLGEMGGAPPPADAILMAAAEGESGLSFSETLYIEIRRGERPVDPAGWFAPDPVLDLTEQEQ